MKNYHRFLIITVGYYFLQYFLLHKVYEFIFGITHENNEYHYFVKFTLLLTCVLLIFKIYGKSLKTAIGIFFVNIIAFFVRIIFFTMLTSISEMSEDFIIYYFRFEFSELLSFFFFPSLIYYFSNRRLENI